MSLYDKASLVQIPSGYKAGKLYSVIPNTSAGDFTVSGDAEGEATRINKNGLIESVAANVARLNYDPANPQDPHLLLEPTRTNGITYSEDFSHFSWNKNNSTVTANNTTAPDGTTNADKITSTGTAPYARASFTHSTLTSYAVSIFGKKGDEDYLYIRALALSNQPIASFNLNTGALGTVNSGLTAEIKAYKEGWYRCTIKYTTTSSISNNLIDFGFASSDNSRFSSSGKFAYFWGAQIEAGNYPTSYIPTSGSAVTRTADTVKLENFVSMPTDYPFTVFSDNDVDLINSSQWAWSILDISSAIKYLGLAFTNSGYIQIHRRNTNNDVDSITTTVTQGASFKFAISFLSDTSYKYSINGGTTVTVTGASTVDFDFNDILIGQQRTSADTGYRNSANQFMMFNEELTDTELQTLTS